jgi:hypothetical protein
MNMQTIEKFKTYRQYYSSNDSKPILIFALSLSNQGIKSTRIAYSFVDMMSRLGGLIKITAIALYFINKLVMKYHT